MKRLNKSLSGLLAVVILFSSIFVCNASAAGMKEYTGTTPLMSYDIVDAVTGTEYNPKADFEGSAVIAVFGNIGSKSDEVIKSALQSLKNITDNAYPGAVKGVYLDIGDATSSTIADFMISNDFETIISAEDNFQNGSYIFDALQAESLYIPTYLVADENGNIRYYESGLCAEYKLVDALLEICGDWVMSDSYVNYYYNNLESNKIAFPDTYINDDMKRDSSTVLTDSKNCYSSIKDDVETIVSGIIEGCTTDYEKVKAISDWVENYIYYDFDYLYGRKSSTYETLVDILNNRTTVCRGYSLVFNNFCRIAGLPCNRILGYCNQTGQWTYDLTEGGSRFTENHMWNEVYVDNRWIIVDTTWNSLNKYENGTFIAGDERDDYFDISIEEFSNDHRITEGFDGTTDSETGYIYQFSSNGVYISGYTGTINGTLNIPETIINRPVGGFHQLAFYVYNVNGTLTNVTVPNTVEEFQHGSFYGNRSLETVNIPYGAVVDNTAFGMCGSPLKYTTLIGYDNSTAETYVSSCTVDSTYIKFKAADCDELGHTQGKWRTAVKASCENGGTTELHCEVCDYLISSNATDAIGHRYKWTDNGGISTGVCVLCNHTITEGTTTSTTTTTTTSTTTTTTTTTTAPTTTTTTTTTTTVPTTTTTATTAPTIKGDIDGNGIVDVKDVLSLKRSLISGNGKYDETLDLSGDGKITSLDIMTLKKIIVNA